MSDPAALEPFERALYAARSYRGDPLAALDEALAAAPDFAAAHVAKALLLMTFFERRFAREALAALDAAQPVLARATPREQALGAAARRLAEGDWHGGTAALDRVLVEHPRDILALQVAHLMDFYRGDSLNLRNRVSRVLPQWSPSLPGHAFVLGMHAFGLEECNQYPEAEAAGMRALEAAPDDSWAVHAVTHVMEMQGRIDEGVRFLEARRGDWAGEDNGFAFHNWWHLALFHMDGGDHQAALALYDRVLAGAHAMAISRVDATALLWRLRLEGVDVGQRFEPLADAWEADHDREGGFYAFNDFHSALAFAAAGRRSAIGWLRDALEAAAWDKGANGEMTRLVGIDACEAAVAFCEGVYTRAVERLLAVRDIAVRFGGSHAQRDLLTLTLIEAARRAGQPGLAAHFARERLVHKPASRWGRRLIERVAGAQQPLAHAA
ncbi:MAG TPA: tetratricopeptide repeat protein [Myxococcota bacterium]|nr:tetratricopeptide repeat protein [Myxococcota bacterium]